MTTPPLDPAAIEAHHQPRNGYCTGCFIDSPSGDAIAWPCETYRLATTVQRFVDLADEYDTNAADEFLGAQVADDLRRVLGDAL